MRTRKQILWWLFSGTKGGYNRALLLLETIKEPQNANQLSQSLGLDYKTVRHHLNVLEKNNVLECVGSGYGNCYFPREFDEVEKSTLNHIFEKMGLEGI
ncbi:MAG TPA: winged helix-turn-helix domain-containing protein [Candidatus Methanofastidiosa archaeon]|nr:winged helix-turn-helix domain-containing protein [Candidatus Methanofastidiosa archaeon]